ncbi:hypothetical protein H4219_002796 [Mycoemilia scoparia]|uniref:Zinc-finger domain-containing protein n=1 Tax=Mycoemilia scoparia TaxID=417184 RepID=A0A9W8DUB5_9FUNG|nr:hypothetical protein H4219_002796 [Mycoemilia scoparia]
MISEYEKERERKIRENQELLMKLGLHKIVRAEEPKIKKPPPAPKKSNDNAEFRPGPPRRSARSFYREASDDDGGYRVKRKPTKKKPRFGPMGLRNSNPGIRVVGGRVYDPVKGSTCHQCRQKTTDSKANGKQCKVCFDKHCLSIRYNEDADEEIKKGNWICPKCRDICNCSFCRRRKGRLPTGQLSTYLKYHSADELAEEQGAPSMRGLTSRGEKRKRRSGGMAFEGLDLTDIDDDNEQQEGESSAKRYSLRLRPRTISMLCSNNGSDDSDPESIDMSSSESEKEDGDNKEIVNSDGGEIQKDEAPETEKIVNVDKTTTRRASQRIKGVEIRDSSNALDQTPTPKISAKKGKRDAAATPRASRRSTVSGGTPLRGRGGRRASAQRKISSHTTTTPQRKKVPKKNESHYSSLKKLHTKKFKPEPWSDDIQIIVPIIKIPAFIKSY